MPQTYDILWSSPRFYFGAHFIYTFSPLDTFFENMAFPTTFYADDSQIYLPLKKNTSSLMPLVDCLNDIKAWMALNFLNINESKTEVIVFGPNGDVPSIGSLQPYAKPMVTNLGVKIDSAFKL